MTHERSLDCQSSFKTLMSSACMSSVESQKGVNAVLRCSTENQKGYCCQSSFETLLSTALMPFWLSWYILYVDVCHSVESQKGVNAD